MYWFEHGSSKFYIECKCAWVMSIVILETFIQALCREGVAVVFPLLCTRVKNFSLELHGTVLEKLMVR